ncbi:MAG: asparagine synthetase B family protein [Pseudomonadota bacterium]
MNGVMGVLGRLTEADTRRFSKLEGIDHRKISDDFSVLAQDLPQGRFEEAETEKWQCYFYGHLFDIEGEVDPGKETNTAARLGRLLDTQGLDGLARSDGRFVVLFREVASGKTILAADPVGLMSIYLNRAGPFLAYATDVNALLQLSQISKEPDPVTISEFLTCSRYNLPVSRSFYRDIEKLPSNCALIVERGERRMQRYWTPSLRHGEEIRDDDQTIVETARQLMLDGTERRMPTGDHMAAALSGGFDSSSVVSMMRHLDGAANRLFTTISFNFGSDAADEEELIDEVSRASNTEHHRVNVLESPFLTETDDVIQSNGGPILESGVLLLWKKKARLAALGHEVSLSGLGGDELFMGRMNFLADLTKRFHWMAAAKEIKAVFPYDRSTGKRTSMRKILNAYVASPLEPYWLKNLRQAKYGNKFPPPWIQEDVFDKGLLSSSLPKAKPPFADTVYQQDCWEVFYYELLNGAITYHSVASNGTGIDTRFPLLDRKLIEYMFRVPRRLKISMGRVRYVQQEAMRPFLPPAILRDHLKKDFHPVLDAHLRKDYGERLDPLFAAKSRLSDDFVDWEGLKSNYAAFQAGKSKPYALWVAYCLERWMQLGT